MTNQDAKRTPEAKAVTQQRKNARALKYSTPTRGIR
jgi:hypothetical protein